MNTHDYNGLGGEGTVHDAVGAYVLGILDDAEATAFEAHLADCQQCPVHLEEFAGLEPMLAMLKDGPGTFSAAAEPFGSPTGLPTSPASLARPAEGFGAVPYGGPVMPPSGSPVSSVPVHPSPLLLERLVGEVAAKRAKRRHRGMYLVAAAAALIVGGPTVAVVATSDGGKAGSTAVAQSDDVLLDHMKTKFSATDPATQVSATIGMESKAWGTDTIMELKNVKGPLKCRLVAVSKTGEQEIVTSWSVPTWGYGIPGSPNEFAKVPLYVHGGAAIKPNDIDHFEVRTSDGKRLVQVHA